MTISHYEAGGSREGTDALDRNSRSTLRWFVLGSDDPDAMENYLLANNVVPRLFRGLVYDSLSWDWKGPQTWEFTATYKHADKVDQNATLDVGEYTFSFDTSGGTVTRKYSLGTTAYGPAGVTVPNYKGLINYDGEDVAGCDITIPQLKFSIRKRQPRASISLAYVHTIHNLTGSTNSQPFLGFLRGELLFLGASGQQGTESDPEITYNFAASPNVSGLTIGDITGIAKRGHQYLWAFYGAAEDSSAKRTIKVPYWVLVEDVYPEADFSQLAI
jgi:hypothetical protein